MTLDYTRLHTDIITCYKFVFNIVQLELSDVFVFNASARVSRASTNDRK